MKRIVNKEDGFGNGVEMDNLLLNSGKVKIMDFIIAIRDVAIEFADESFSDDESVEQKAAFLDSVAILLNAVIWRLHEENKVENVSLERGGRKRLHNGRLGKMVKTR